MDIGVGRDIEISISISDDLIYWFFSPTKKGEYEFPIERSAISIDCDPTRGVFDIVREGNKEIVVLHTNSFRGETFKFNLYVDNIVGRFKTKVIIDPVIVNDGTGEA